MLNKLNCWDIIKCGRQVDGERVDDLGVCPVASAKEFTAANSGDCGGRACWKVMEKVGNNLIPHWSDPDRSCLSCRVFQLVRDEEKDCFIL